MKKPKKTKAIQFSHDIIELSKIGGENWWENKFIKSIFDLLVYPFYVVDAKDYTIKFANSATGKFPQGACCYSVTHKIKKPCIGDHLCPLDEIKKTKRPVVVKHVHYDKDGIARNVEVHGYPVLDEKGEVAQIIEYSLDITKNREAEIRLKEGEEKFRLITEASPDCVKLFDVKGKLLHINQGGIDEHRLKSLKEALDSNWSPLDTLVEEDKAKFKKAFVDARYGKSSNIEIRHTKEGSIRDTCLETIVPIKNAQGRVVKIFGVSRDISKFSEKDDLLKKQIKELKKFQDLIIGRELKMIELKREIKALKEKLPSN